jgi:hypothetical protein
MKTKSILLALALFTAGLLAAQIPDQLPKVTITVDTLLDRAALNRTISRALAPLSAYAGGYFQGKADAQEELAALKGP